MKKILRWQQVLHRRDLLKIGLAGGASLAIGGCASLSSKMPMPSAGAATAGGTSGPEGDRDFLRSHGPIDRTLADVAPRQFSGDNFERPHRILWDRQAYLAEKNVEGPVEQRDLVIIGGGVSGLFTAFALRAHNPMILEQADRFGGNAKGESWSGIDYSIGAAYVDEPQPGSSMHKYFQDLNLGSQLAQREASDPVEARGKLYSDFWEGGAEPKDAKLYKKLETFFQSLVAGKDHAFPSIPAENAAELEAVRYYDKWSLHQIVTKILGGRIPPHLETMLEHYCWSTYAASSTELSASAALNFLAHEAMPIRVGAGGNSKIAEILVSRLLKDLSPRSLRPSSIAVKVDVRNNDRVRILYEDGQQKLREISAKAVVMCCPKFVVSKILDGMEPTRLKAIKSLNYRSYMTANLLIDAPIEQVGYDIYMTGQGKADMKNVEKSQRDFNATDFIVANFASPHPDRTVLTFYRAFPYDGGRRELFQPPSHDSSRYPSGQAQAPSLYDSLRKTFEDQIDRQIIPLLKLNPKSIRDLRMARWGHALPLASTGIYRGDTIEHLRAPFRERVFFVEQDNWACPALTTGATESALMSPQIAKLL